jgi:hypothetical protein
VISIRSTARTQGAVSPAKSAPRSAPGSADHGDGSRSRVVLVGPVMLHDRVLSVPRSCLGISLSVAAVSSVAAARRCASAARWYAASRRSKWCPRRSITPAFQREAAQTRGASRCLCRPAVAAASRRASDGSRARRISRAHRIPGPRARVSVVGQPRAHAGAVRVRCRRSVKCSGAMAAKNLSRTRPPGSGQRTPYPRLNAGRSFSR